MRKLPVFNQLHQKESKHDKRCSSYWADFETDDHLLQCPKQSRHRNNIYQAITRLETEIDPTLHDILRDCVGIYLGGIERTLCNEGGLANNVQYFHLQQT